MSAAEHEGRTLGDFVIEERLGEGSFGVVYRARQPLLERSAVVKILHRRLVTGAETSERFMREARTASRLDHPYAAHIYASGAEDDGTLWIAMEYVRGTPLSDYLRAEGPIPPETFIPFFERLCEVVQNAHEQGIVHRDIKPANVMVLPRAGRLLPKLLDFGIAKALIETALEDSAAAPGSGEGHEPPHHVSLAATLPPSETSDTIDDRAGSDPQELGSPAAPARRHATPLGSSDLTQRGELIGSPYYMAPEQWEDATAVDARCDLYALGVLAYESLTGSVPFVGETLRDLCDAHRSAAPPRLPDHLPDALSDAVSRAMAKAPAARFDDAIELAAAFSDAAGVRAPEAPTWDVARDGSPFRGLEAFDESHRNVFFGRKNEVERARARLLAAAERGRSSLLVVGPSGSGKSSFVRAGLVPRLSEPDGAAGRVERWRRLVVRPSELAREPLGEFARAVRERCPLPELGENEEARAHAGGADELVAELSRALDRWSEHLAKDGERRPATGLVVVVDQLEELFRLEQAAYEALSELLAELSRAPRVWLVATLRSDFYPELHADVRLTELKDGGSTLDLAAPSASRMRAIIEGAASAAGLVLEDDGRRSLADHLEEEARAPGALPMVQFALQELFEARDRERGVLRLADYDALGGVAGALATQAERVLARIGGEAEHAFERVLWRLVDISNDSGASPRGRSTPLADFPAGSKERLVVDALLEARLLVAWGDREAYVRVAHESLFTHWPRAAGYIGRFRRDLETRTRLEQAQALWEGAPDTERPARLLHGLALEEARDLRRRRAGTLSGELGAFIDASSSAARGRRQKRRAIVATVMLALAALAFSATWFGVRADRARAEAEGAKAQAEKLLELQLSLFEDMAPEALAAGFVERIRADVKAAGGTDELVESFDAAAAASSPVDVVRELLVERVLEPAEARMDEELSDSPAVHARFQDTLARIYITWGDYGAAETLAEAAKQTLRNELGEDHPDALHAAESRAFTMHGSGDYEGARALHEATLTSRRRVLGEEHPKTIESMVNLAGTLSPMGRNDEALELGERAVELGRRVVGNHDKLTLSAQNNLALALYRQAEHDAARDILQEVLSTRREVLGAEHPDTMTAMSNVALVLDQLGEFDESRRIREELVSLRRRVLGEEHPATLTAESGLAVALTRGGDYQRALELHERTLAARRRVLGEEHPLTVTAMQNVGAALRHTGEYEDARQILEETLAHRREALGGDHPHTLLTMRSLAGTLRAAGEHEASLEVSEEALGLSSEAFGDAHLWTLRTQNGLAETLVELGEPDGALKHQKLVLDRLPDAVGEDHPDMASARHTMARILRQQGRDREARDQFQRAVDASRAARGLRHSSTTRKAESLVLLLREMGERDAAREIAGEYLDWLRDADPDTLEANQRRVKQRIQSPDGQAVRDR